MKVIFSPFAKQELKDAIEFYNLEYRGLGNKFKQEVKISITRILHYPYA